LAEWLVEAGIGETRFALIAAGAIVEARIALDGTVRAGSVVEGRFLGRDGPFGRLALAAGGEALLKQVPAGLSEGTPVQVVIEREAVPERGRWKLPIARCVDPSAPPPAPDLPAPRPPGPGPDALEAAGWSDLLDQAETGRVPFPGGLLRIDLTAGMTVIDIDGALPPDELARRGAAAAGAAIRRFGIGGSIGIDLPTVGGRAARQAAAAALDAALPPPFERTAVNGFGFLQLIRPRRHASLPELVQADRAGAAARALLRRAERAVTGGRHVLVAPAAVARVIAARPGWLAELGRRTGAALDLRADPALPMSGGHVEPQG
jgi:ribonuclease G